MVTSIPCFLITGWMYILLPIQIQINIPFKGLQTLVTFAAKGHEVISKTDSYNHLSRVELTEYGKKESNLFSAAPEWLMAALESTELASNFHFYSLLKTTYDENPNIKKIFNVVSYSYSRDNLKYVAIVESKKLVFLLYLTHFQ